MRAVFVSILLFMAPIVAQTGRPIVPHHPVLAKKGFSKISPLLWDAMQEVSVNPAFVNKFRQTAQSLGILQIAADGRLFVRLKCTAEISSILDKLKYMGISITSFHEGLGWIDCWVRSDQIEQLAADPAIRNISECERGHLRTGSVTSEGDTLHKTDLIRSSFGADGSGVKVGVISDGVDNIASSQSTSDLPATVNVLDNTAGGDEGTAMLEIVHDLAPGADLYFSTGFNSATGFINSVNNLVAAGCSVVVDDIGYFGEPWFEEGPIATAVHNAITNDGIVYASSAGNSQDEHYEGDYSPVTPSPAIPGISEAHDFGGGDYGQSFTLGANQTFYIFIQWNEPFGAATSDYVIHLVNSGLTSRYAISTNRPDANDPYAYLGAIGGPGTFNIVIERTSGANRRVEIAYNFGGAATLNEFNTLPGSINGQPVVADVIATGAVRYNTPSTIENFSSIGPCRIYSYPAYTYETRSKPDIVAMDGNIITGAGGFGQEFPTGSGNIRFFGTSAAAPHAAACAAALWSAFPNFTNSEIKQRLLNYAVDLGSPGFDYIYGYGRINMQNSGFSPQFTVAGVNGGSSAVISGSLAPGDALAELAGYRLTANLSPYRAYLDSLTLQITGTATAADIDSFSLYVDVNDDRVVTPAVDSLLGTVPFASSLAFGGLGFGFDNTGPVLILTADVNPLANQTHAISVLLNNTNQVAAYFGINPLPTNFPIQVSDISLPVELTAFEAVPHPDRVDLYWETASEINNSHFEVYRELASRTELLATISGAGNSSQATRYNFIDEDIQPRTNISYTLYSVALDGMREKLAEHSVQVPAISQLQLYPNYPNPFNPGTTVRFALPNTARVIVDVFDIQGRRVAKLSDQEMPAGVHKIYFDGSRLVSGVYFLRLQANEGDGKPLSKLRRIMLLK